MPVIPMKSMRVTVVYAQMRRIQCEHCMCEFTYLDSGAYEERSTGIPIVESADRLRRLILKSAIRTLTGMAETRRSGVARCPSCNKPQRWMVRRIYAMSIGLLGGVFGLSLPFFAAMAAALAGADPVPWTVVAAVVGLLGGVGGGVYSATRAIEGPPGDPRALTDSDVRELLRVCIDDDVDPAIHWHFEILGSARPNGASIVVSLGMRDELGSFRIPADLRTEDVVSRLRDEIE